MNMAASLTKFGETYAHELVHFYVGPGHGSSAVLDWLKCQFGYSAWDMYMWSP